MSTRDNTAAGVRIRKWDEVNGTQEEQSEPGVSPQDHMDGPLLQAGNRNYLRTAEELTEDDYSSVDGIINNGERYRNSGTKESAEDEREKSRVSVMDKIREHEDKQRSLPPVPPPMILNPEKEKDPLCPDRNLC